MPKEETFTLAKLEELELQYLNAKQIRVMIEGKWKYYDMTPGAFPAHIQGVRAEHVRVKDRKTFVEYLRGVYGNG